MRGSARAKPWTGAGTASVAALRPMITFARTVGVPVETLLREIGLSVAALDDYDRRIPEADRARMWIEATEQSHDPPFGLHVAEHAQVGAYDVLDYSLSFSSTVGEALDHINRFHRVLCDAWAIQLEVHGRTVRLRRVERTPPAEAESTFAVLALRTRELTQARPALEVRFAHAAPSDTGAHEALFQCPVRFNRATTEMVFDASNLAVPVRSANPGLNRVLERYMTEVLDRLPKNESFLERARAAVSRTLHHAPPTLERTARELHTSPRTLQRKLGDLGCTHTEVVASVRREMAERLVAEHRVSITEIAFLLGFADVSGFRRMYKRWTGVSPARARLSLRH